jgi:hypothetical protein
LSYKKRIYQAAVSQRLRNTVLDNNGRRDFMSYKNCLLSEILKSSERARKDRSGKFFKKVKIIWLLEKVLRIKKMGFFFFHLAYAYCCLSIAVALLAELRYTSV